MERTLVGLGALVAAAAVAAGAFATHALRGAVTPEDLVTFETGARYGVYHGIAMILTGLALGRWPSRLVTAAGWCFLAGSLLFTGSLFLLVLTGTRWLGAVTPLGGAAFIGGWLLLAIGVWRTPAHAGRGAAP